MAPILGIWASSKAVATDTGAMFPLQVITVGPAGASSVSFTNIPNTYTHLQIRASIRSAVNGASSNFWIRYNGDATSGNYAWHYLTGDGASATAGKEQPSTVNLLGPVPAATSSAGNFGATIFDILDYANTNKYKTVRALTGYDANGSGSIWFGSGLWLSTSAITSIYIQDSAANNLAAGSTFALYAVKGA